jgi:Outer membrane protein beta-barrel domain
MKKRALIFLMVLISATAWSQETITLSGGVAYARAIDYSSYYSIDYNNLESTGFRITGTYEIGPLVTKKLLHGFSSSYILTNASFSESNFNADIKVRTIPMYYAPKFMIGGEKAMAFARGAVGIQFARFEIEGDYEDKDNDWGFYGGIGLGGMVYLSDKVFLNLEYEWAYMSNTYYANGILNSLQLGIGVDL